MSEKINVVSCELKPNTGSYTIYLLTTVEGIKFDSFDKVDPGEHEGEIQPNANPEYNSRFKLKKEKKFGTKDWSFEKKRVAHQTAVKLWSMGKISDEQFQGTRDKFFEYLNNG